MLQSLLEKGYTRVRLVITKTNHLEIVAKLNRLSARFLVDTGASNSCLDFSAIKKFHLISEETENKAAGAGALEMPTKISRKNRLEIGLWTHKKSKWILFDMVHVNTALSREGAQTVDGIIGADILKRSKAVIDYKNRWLYLKN
ncbi:MAG: retropepsin-like aspartic protease [Flavobacteriaceae bacterium]|nr:retropepsin-like aspartic protease [Flavobacteriaceae bacterium]